MDIAHLMSFWLVSLLLIITPGPDWAFVLSFAFRRRSIITPLAGIALGYLGLSLVVAAGLGALVAQYPILLTVVTLLGVFVLLRIGWTMLMAARRGGSAAELTSSEPESSGNFGAQSATRTIGKGMAVSGLNPKGLMLFIALLPQFVSAENYLPVSMQMLSLGLVFIVSATVFYAALGACASRVLSGSERASRVLSGTAGVAMMAAAIALLTQQVLS